MEQEKTLNELTLIQQYTYKAVKELQDKCVAEHRAPVCANLYDVYRMVQAEIKEALNGFVNDKTMKWWQNVNGVPLFKIENPIK